MFLTTPFLSIKFCIAVLVTVTLSAVSLVVFGDLRPTVWLQVWFNKTEVIIKDHLFVEFG